MLLRHEETPSTWDKTKSRVFADTGGCFEFDDVPIGYSLPGRWWRFEDCTGVVGYGWLAPDGDYTQLGVVVDARSRGASYGSSILCHLVTEAKAMGLDEVLATVRPQNPNGERVLNWLSRNGFAVLGGISVEGARLVLGASQSVTLVKSLS